jgi:hypothetical protein
VGAADLLIAKSFLRRARAAASHLMHHFNPKKVARFSVEIALKAQKQAEIAQSNGRYLA